MTPEESIAASIGVVLQRSYRSAITDEMVARLPAGTDAVDATTYPVISGVARLGPVRVAALGEAIGLERSVVSRRSTRLVRAGLLRAEPDPGDARADLLTLTPEGAEVVGHMRAVLVAGLARQLAGWSEADREALARLLARFVETELGAGAEPGSVGGPAPAPTPHPHPHPQAGAGPVSRPGSSSR